MWHDVIVYYSYLTVNRTPYAALTSQPFNQAKDTLTKQWLGNDEANRSPVVCEQFGRCLLVVKSST